MRRTQILFLIIACSPNLACGASRPSSAGGFTMTLEDQFGAPLQSFAHRGSTFVEGHLGTRYRVRVHNHTHERVEAVVTVDGRDVISGEVGDYVHQRGYIIGPHSSVIVDGFRRSLSTVATFRFTDAGDSYSSRRGTPQHLGVVGVAVFKERRIKPQLRRQIGRGPALNGRMAPSVDHVERNMKSSSGGLAPQSASRNRIGTQFGEQRHSAVVEVGFVRRNRARPHQVLSVYYDDLAGLRARGVPTYRVSVHDPDPFPRQRFASPPQ